MSWFFLALLSAFTGALSRILQKTAMSKAQSDPFAFGFVFQLVVAALFFLYSLATSQLEFPSLSAVALNIVCMTMLYSFGNLFVFFAFKYAQAAEVTVILSTSVIWSVLSAVLFLGERLTLLNAVGIGLIVSGVIVLHYTPEHAWKVGRGHAFALAGALAYGLAFTNDAFILGSYRSVSSYMIVAFTFPALFMLLYRPQLLTQLRQFAQPRTFLNLLLTSAVYSISALSIFTAYKMGGQASILSPIQQTSMIFVVILGALFLKERDKPLQKIAGTLLAFLGVLFLV